MSLGCVWDERVTANLFLTYSLLKKEIEEGTFELRDRKEMGVSSREKLQGKEKKKTCVTKCSLWKNQLNVKIKRKKINKTFETGTMLKAF